jgi:hypothetical protein
MALTHNGKLYLLPMSTGFSGKPHGSAKMRCFTLGNSIIHIYVIAKDCLETDKTFIKIKMLFLG